MPTVPGEKKPLPGPDDILALLKFLPVLQSPDFAFAKQGGGTRRRDGAVMMPYWILSGEAARFCSVLYDRGFIRPFNWVAWKREAEQLVNDPDALGRADLETICRLLTVHVRQERFCEGHLQAMHECGHLTAVLRRLATLATSG